MMLRTARHVSFWVVGAALLLFALFALHGATPRARAVFDDTDGDHTIDATELVTGSNPNDAQSLPEDFTLDTVLDESTCNDGIDNDRDGSIDHADSGCVDTDSDFYSDQLEANVGSDTNNEESYPESARFDAMLAGLGYGYFQTCADEVDDDGDGNVDAADSGCDPTFSDSDSFDDRVEKLFGSDPHDASSVPEHELVNPGSCSDGLDNDRDGAIDGAEPACQPVSNDDFADAKRISTLPYDDELKLSGATSQPDEPQAECSFIDETVGSAWYAYTPPADVAVAVGSVGANTISSVAVWTQIDGHFNGVACTSSFGPTTEGEPHATFLAAAGETYYIQLLGVSAPNSPAMVHVHVDLAHPPAHDNYASAREISTLPFHETVNVADATTEPQEPASDCVDQPYSTVWYRYTAPSAQLLIADPAGSTYPALTSVWTDSSFGLVAIACARLGGPVAFHAEAGHTYWFQISAPEAGSATELSFGVQVGVPPANDNFADATVVSSLPFDANIDLLTASFQSGEPTASCAFGATDKTVWYSVTAPRAGYVTAAIGERFEPTAAVLTAHRGSSLGDLTEAGCVSPLFGDQNSFAIPVSAGETLYIRVTNLPELPGLSTGISLHLAFQEIPSCAPAAFTVNDPRGDAFVFGTGQDIIDATLVSGGNDGTNYCVRIQFADPLPVFDRFTGATASIAFDTDSNPSTGSGGADFPCGAPLGSQAHGSEIVAHINLTRDVVVPLGVEPPPIFVSTGGLQSQPTVFAIVVYGERSMQVMVPMSALGDDQFFLDVSFNGQSNTDCVPNGGSIRSPVPAQPGDVNCDGVTNSLDSSLILQRVANLLPEDLICEYAGDVNQSEGVGPIDAVLILQYSAGLLPELSAS